MSEGVGKEPFLDGKAPAHLQRTARRVYGGIVMPSGEPIRQEDLGIQRSEFGVVEGDTVMCVHCGMHWGIQPGSGMKRGFCGNCAGLTCGKRPCETECVPFEKALELIEGRDPNKTQF